MSHFDNSKSIGNQPRWKIVWFCLIIGDLRAAIRILLRR